MADNDAQGSDRSGDTATPAAMEKLSSWLEISPAELVHTVAALEPGGEDRLLRICFLAEDLFHGDRQTARWWVKSPAYAFKGESPFEHARTEQGAQEVETLIGRLKHGIPS